MSVWFVTGASRGFGAEIVKEALARGNQVVATARKPEDIPFSGDDVLALALDVTDESHASTPQYRGSGGSMCWSTMRGAGCSARSRR